MSIILTLGEVLRAISDFKSYTGDAKPLVRRPESISTDSRTLPAGSLFFALRGEKFDGHEFVAKAFEQGALAAVVEQRWYESSNNPEGAFIIVNDSLKALQKLGMIIRQRWGKPIIAITGSNGKSTTKEMIAAVLGQKMVVHKTTGNLNNHIGVPLTLSEISYGHDFSVLEMGANHFGEIADLCQIATPNFGLVTNVGRGHTEFFGNVEGVARAKAELFEYMRTRDGIAFLNADDAHLPKVLPSGLKTISFGFKNPAQIQGKIDHIDAEGRAHISWHDLRVRLKSPGSHNAINALAAIAVGNYFGIEPARMKEAIENCEVLAKRMQILQISGMTVINDAYNANPDSLRAALEFLAQMPVREGGRRVAVLGDMLELGHEAEAAHRELGEFITTLPVQAVFAHGPHMQHLIRAVGEYCWAEHFQNKDNLINEVKRSVRQGDVILVKGSRGMAMEETVDRLMQPL